MSELDRLRAIMERLRGPDGCPWDREQTLGTLATFLLEETHEVLEAIAEGRPEAHMEELGDLLFQIIFQAQVAREAGDFDLDMVMRSIGDKIVRRHPHVFSNGRLNTSGEVLKQWEEIKAVERRAQRERSMFASVPEALPALLKALRISSKAARVGFDWVDREDLLAKVDEELGELREALMNDDRAAVAEELGDLLFTLANVARSVDLDPEAALQAANRKFISRFRQVEEGLRRRGLEPSERNRPAMERLWGRAKDRIRKTSPARTSPSAGTSGSALRHARRRTST